MSSQSEYNEENVDLQEALNASFSLGIPPLTSFPALPEEIISIIFTWAQLSSRTRFFPLTSKSFLIALTRNLYSRLIIKSDTALHLLHKRLTDHNACLVTSIYIDIPEPFARESFLLQPKLADLLNRLTNVSEITCKDLGRSKVAQCLLSGRISETFTRLKVLELEAPPGCGSFVKLSQNVLPHSPLLESLTIRFPQTVDWYHAAIDFNGPYLSLTTLSLVNNLYENTFHLTSLLGCFPNLESLSIEDARRLVLLQSQQFDLPTLLSQVPSTLKHLRIACGTNTSATQLSATLNHFPNLLSLEIGHNPFSADTFFTDLHHLHSIRSLKFDSTTAFLLRDIKALLLAPGRMTSLQELTIDLLEWGREGTPLGNATDPSAFYENGWEVPDCWEYDLEYQDARELFELNSREEEEGGKMVKVKGTLGLAVHVQERYDEEVKAMNLRRASKGMDPI